MQLMDNLFASVKLINVHVLFPCHNCETRIEVLVLVTALVLVVSYILDMFRRRSGNQVFLFLLIMLASLPYALVTYTIGLMQLSKSDNDTYQAWAVVLVTLLYSIKAARPSGIYGKQNPLHDVMSSLWTANLLGSRTTTLLKIPLWLLWSLNSVRIILGFADTELTSSRYQKNLRLLTEYMRTEHKHTPLKDCDPRKMKGYRYLVCGEDKQKIKSEPPEYRVQLEVTKEKAFITTNKVWEKNGALFGKPKESNELKDLCLAFALFKLLLRRFFGLPFHEANQPKTKELVVEGLIKSDNYNRAFQITEAELAFLNDYFFTRFAVMFSSGFPIPRLLLSLSVIGVASYLAVIFHHSSDLLKGDLSKTTDGVSITWMLLVILIIKETWEMATYVLSDWTKVVLISNYVQQPWWTRFRAIVAVAKLLCKYKIAKRWHGTLWQYNLLQSFRYFPHIHKPLYIIFGCHAPCGRVPGCNRSPQITLSKEVKIAISESLQYLSNQPEALQKYLSTAANSLPRDFEQRISFTNDYSTDTQKILVWHIATCYCEIMLAKTSQKTSLESHYKGALALSQYSAYLVKRKSPLVPDRQNVATELFRSTLDATRDIFRHCRTWEKFRLKLEWLSYDNNGIVDGNEEDHGGSQKEEREGPILEGRLWKGDVIFKSGVRLGRILLEGTETDIQLWKFLEKFWAGYLIYLAASVSPKCHKQSLSQGGQFLTHLWALLTHAGVLGKTVSGSPLDYA